MEKKENSNDLTIDLSKENDIVKLESMAYRLTKDINRCNQNINNIELRIIQIKNARVQM
jgi:hypothetical protein